MNVEVEGKNRTVQVGSLRIGEGMPKICVPIVAGDLRDAGSQAEKIMFTPADLVEWRADLYGEGTSAASQDKALKVISETLENKPLIFTLRTSREGGKWSGSSTAYGDILKNAIENDAVSILDVEFSADEEIRNELIGKAHEAGKKVILSFHDFEGTPSEHEMAAKLDAMKEAGGDIAKIAVMPKERGDVLRLMSAGSTAAASEDAIPVIAISMGSLGSVSRISGESFGSAVTFASVGRNSAPGQMDADTVDSILIDMHRSLTDDPAYALRREGLKNGRNLVLVGFMGSGKSRISRLLEQKCGMRAVEIDTEIEKAEGMKVSEIFAQKGEAYFRDLETEITKNVSRMKNVVISCGGGTVMRRENVDALRSGGRVIMLRAKPETVHERVKRSRGKRPLLAKYMSRGYISWLMKQRDDRYKAAADFILDVDGIDSEGAAELIQRNFSISRRKKHASHSGRTGRKNRIARGQKHTGKKKRRRG